MKTIVIFFLLINPFIFNVPNLVAYPYYSIEARIINSDSVSIGKLIINAPIIVEGTIEPLDYSELNFRVFKVKIKDVLKGNIENKDIIIIESLMLDSEEGPAAMFSTEYILFLEKLTVEEEYRDALNKLKVNNYNVFHVYNNWRGAICLDNKWSEMINYYIERNYGIDRAEIKRTIEVLCGRYSEKSDFIPLNNYKNKIYQEFEKEMIKSKIKK